MEKLITLGQKRVRTNFNTTSDDFISQIKDMGARYIDLINLAASKPEWNNEEFAEWKRLQSLALTSIEQAAMWAVKAATI